MTRYPFPLKPIDGDKLQAEIAAAGLPVAAIAVIVSGSEIGIVFTRDLTAPEQTTLAGLVDAHVPWTAAQILAAVKEEAKAMYDRLDAMFRLLRGAMGMVVDENNLLRARLRDQDTAVAGASSLAALKTAWATVATASPMPDRTDAQARTALRNRIDAQI